MTEENKKDLTEYMGAVAGQYEGAIAVSAELGPGIIEISCIYLASDPHRINLMTLRDTCGPNDKVVLLDAGHDTDDRQSSFLKTFDWLLSDREEGDLVIVVTLFPDQLAAIGTRIIESG